MAIELNFSFKRRRKKRDVLKGMFIFRSVSRATVKRGITWRLHLAKKSKNRKEIDEFPASECGKKNQTNKYVKFYRHFNNSNYFDWIEWGYERVVIKLYDNNKSDIGINAKSPILYGNLRKYANSISSSLPAPMSRFTTATGYRFSFF